MLGAAARFLHSGTMFKGLEQAWSRHAIGYRQGTLDDGDAVAATVVVVVGGPVFLVGGMLTYLDGLSLMQVILLAPVAGVIGGLLVGAAAAAAASTGASASWLAQPAFGRLGALLVSVLRLGMLAVWTVVGLQIIGEWTAQMIPGGPSPLIGILAVAGLGVLLTVLGVVATTRRVVRKPLFVASVVLVGFLAWRFVSQLEALAGGTGGQFWSGLQRAVEMAVVFLPFVEVVSRHLRDERVATSSFGVGYAVPTTVMLLAGALTATGLGSLPGGVVGADLGELGLLAVLAWVIVAEVDQAYAGFAAAGAEGTGILRFGSAPVVGGLFVFVIVALAAAGPPISLEWASMLTAVLFPAAVIAALDFHVSRDRHYAESDMYGVTQAVLNPFGVIAWLGAVLVGQALDPLGPQAVIGYLPSFGVDLDLPWRLLSAAIFGLAYLASMRVYERRRSSTFGLRGV